MTLGRFCFCYLRNARDLMPNFHPILFKFCAYVNNMLTYKMHRERFFPMAIINLAALFLELFESPSYIGGSTTWDLYKFNKEMELLNEPCLRLVTLCPNKGLSRRETYRWCWRACLKFRLYAKYAMLSCILC